MLEIMLSKGVLLTLPLLAAAEDPPPGLVLVKGGKVTVGTPVKEVEDLILTYEQQRKSLAGETPEIKVEVEDFYLGVTEVTNEQYAEYVRATGAKPPWYWGEAATNAAGAAFNEEQGRQRAEAVKAGKKPGPRELFDAPAWWDKNWKDADWEVPKDLLSHPVTHLDHGEVQGYVRWAGLRLMTEFEFQRAARGDDGRRYPWGDDWSENMAATVEMGRNDPMPVGSFPQGAVNGIYDLAGNVWEWTDSPYVEFKGYKPVKVKQGKRTIEALASFNANHRVVVGGSFSNPRVAARSAARFGSERTQVTAALGFRVAASVEPGLDAAQIVLNEDVRLNVLPDDVEFYVPGTVIARRWKDRDGVAKNVKQIGGDAGTIADYRVITGYDQVFFVPVTEVGAGSEKDLERDTESAPVFVGFFNTSMPLAEPELEPGTYLVAWRGRNKLEDPEAPEDKDPFFEAKGFDEDENQFVFYDLDANALACVSSAGMLYDKMRTSGSVTVEPFVPPTAEELEKMKEEGIEPPRPLDTLQLSLAVAGKARSKGFLFDLAVLVDPEHTPDATWRNLTVREPDPKKRKKQGKASAE